jgi:hypothetical protein
MGEFINYGSSDPDMINAILQRKKRAWALEDVKYWNTLSQGITNMELVQSLKKAVSLLDS